MKSEIIFPRKQMLDILKKVQNKYEPEVDKESSKLYNTPIKGSEGFELRYIFRSLPIRFIFRKGKGIEVTVENTQNKKKRSKTMTNLSDCESYLTNLIDEVLSEKIRFKSNRTYEFTKAQLIHVAGFVHICNTAKSRKFTLEEAIDYLRKEGYEVEE